VRRIVPDNVLLFRYSALTFNSHRIHYDRRYATEVEGYPGLVIHGPLLATLLVDLWRRQQSETALSGFEFRALRPLFDTAPFELCGCPEDDGRVALWAQGPDGAAAMRATATRAPSTPRGWVATTPGQ
jgi:3-methylfumaryl-CoA hydratase